MKFYIGTSGWHYPAWQEIFYKHKLSGADFIYVRFHGPEQMFASNYSEQQLQEWTDYINGLAGINQAYIYFNNTMHGHARRQRGQTKRRLDKRPLVLARKLGSFGFPVTLYH